MKLITALLCLTSVFSAYAVTASPGLNECLPIPATKKYISTEFHTYPRTVIFECTYQCNAEGSVHSIAAISNVTINNFEEDARMTTCQGVVVKKTNWGFDFDKIEAFYAPDTKLKELKKWAFENINFDPETNAQEKAKLTKLKQDLIQISSSFITAGSTGPESTRYFTEAGVTLAKIAEGLPMNTKKLDEVINRIVEPKTSQTNQATDLVDLFIQSSASWRIPLIN